MPAPTSKTILAGFFTLNPKPETLNLFWALTQNPGLAVYGLGFRDEGFGGLRVL